MRIVCISATEAAMVRTDQRDLDYFPYSMECENVQLPVSGGKRYIAIVNNQIIQFPFQSEYEFILASNPFFRSVHHPYPDLRPD